MNITINISLWYSLKYTRKAKNTIVDSILDINSDSIFDI